MENINLKPKNSIENKLPSNIEAEQALISLGYKPVEAAKMLSTLSDIEETSVEDIIRAALQSRLKA